MSLSACVSAHRSAFTQRRLPAHAPPSHWDSPPPYADVGGRFGEPDCFPLGSVSGTETRILIADQRFSAGSLVRMLRGLGFQLAQTAFCGASALQLAQEFRPAIVLVALDLPDMSARYIGRRLSERATPDGVRLIALADDHSLASRDRVREAGFARYLTKPVAVAALRQVLEACRA
jgi:CheY-like chemotaxis protein